MEVIKRVGATSRSHQIRVPTFDLRVHVTFNLIFSIYLSRSLQIKTLKSILIDTNMWDPLVIPSSFFFTISLIHWAMVRPTLSSSSFEGRPARATTNRRKRGHGSLFFLLHSCSHPLNYGLFSSSFLIANQNLGTAEREMGDRENRAEAGGRQGWVEVDMGPREGGPSREERPLVQTC